MNRFSLVCATWLALVAASTAAADDYPTKPVKILVGFPPGSGTDISARRLAQALSQNLKTNFYVDNKPGAGGALAADTVARAAPDGYTLLASSSGPLVLSPLINKNVRFDLLRDFTPIAVTSSAGYVFAVSADSRFASLKDFVTAAKANPGKLSYASSGIGVTNHLLMEILKDQTKTFIVHVPYKGSANGLNDLAASQVDAMFDVWPAMLPLVTAGKLRPLAIATDKRNPAFANVPTVAEAGFPGLRGEAWTAILAPAATPAAVVTKIHAEIDKILRTPEWQEFVRSMGGTTPLMAQSGLNEFIKSEMSRWSQVVKRTKVQTD